MRGESVFVIYSTRLGIHVSLFFVTAMQPTVPRAVQTYGGEWRQKRETLMRRTIIPVAAAVRLGMAAMTTGAMARAGSGGHCGGGGGKYAGGGHYRGGYGRG